MEPPTPPTSESESDGQGPLTGAAGGVGGWWSRRSEVFRAVVLASVALGAVVLLAVLVLPGGGNEGAPPETITAVTAQAQGASILPGSGGGAAAPAAALSAKFVPSSGALLGVVANTRAGRSHEQEVQFLESEIGRRFDLVRNFHAWDADVITSAEEETRALGRIPIVN